jgi:hypothetical protein
MHVKRIAALGATIGIAGALSVAAIGPAGAKSHPASPASQVVSGFINVPPGANGLVTATCPSSKIVTGGGGQTSAFRIFFTDSFQNGVRAWSIRGTNTGGSTEQLRANAICIG